MIVAGVQAIFKLNAQTQLLIFFALTLSIGMLHGMLDIVIFSQVPLQYWRFLTLYLLAVLGLVYLLLTIEWIALPILLLLSVWHFGEPQRLDKTLTRLLPQNFHQVLQLPLQPRLQDGLQRYLLGANSLAAPFFLQGESLHSIVSSLTNSLIAMPELTHVGWLLWSLIALAWLPAMVIFIGLLLLKQVAMNSDLTATFLETAVVWLAFAMLPIWLAFALYFATYHAIRHIRDVWHAATSRMDIGLQPRLFNVVLNICVIGLITIVIIVYVLSQIYVDMPAYISIGVLQAGYAQWLRMLVIVLAAVTLPHAILVHYWRKQLF